MTDSECVKPVISISSTSTTSNDPCTKNNSDRICPNDGKQEEMQETSTVSDITQPPIKVFVHYLY